ncbi:fatty acid desaturase [filamentous cyanobacterium LEGE 11480]|uniref:Fatty acid desaturase n=1 Tax=Romeriopsis navalis LEGE 11480 TaxID=2777977 RepID=A0A928VH30_9CYAN|nr:fatty acid desaturase [Romeriopsis navalis]MBE9028491.1 fatty acid desaturase [Romeriopsis navalis LEGE 11480]
MTATITELPRPRWEIITSTAVLHLLALLGLLPGNFSWAAVGVAVLLHAITIGLGISLGFHRLASHRSFQVPRWLEYFFILCGTLAGQGAVLGWVGYHRLHHLHTDQPLDPHDSTQGLWWSHISWLMHTVPVQSQRARFTKDIADDPFYQFCHNYYIPMQAVLGVLLYAIGGWPFVVWGIFVRLFVGFHSTCFVNSVCHKFGYQSHNTGDRSTNCWWVALLTFGEGWHNNHHAQQSSARYGQKWWEIDLVWQTIRLMQGVGLATKVKS